jgi:CDGSH-type Zn-finger protein
MADKAKVFVNPKSGSIRITGEVDLVDSEGVVIETLENPKFCGCGQSKEKPFCDGSHKGLLEKN